MLTLACLFPAVAHTRQTPVPAHPAAVAAEQAFVVTDFRGAASVALDEKRTASGPVDRIKADAFATFPDNSLAESIQRVPGVAIARDEGEGRSISVRRSTAPAANSMAAFVSVF